MAVIRGASRLYGVRTPEQWAELHAAAIRERGDAGLIDVGRPFQSHAAVMARIDGGEWLIDCACGAGAALEPAWGGVARCFACGAVHANVILPTEADRLNIEHVVAARPHAKNRWWSPGETLLDLALENAERGVRF